MQWLMVFAEGSHMETSRHYIKDTGLGSQARVWPLP